MIIADTGFWLAVANRDDTHHGTAKAALARVREPLVTTMPVMTETCHLMLSRLGVRSQLAFIQSWGRGAFCVFDVSEVHADRIHELMERYQELPMDLADASLVILAEELGTGRILSTDQRDFRAYRWKHRKPFKNLLLE
jgi:predicted nucleic acid-binding protein